MVFIYLGRILNTVYQVTLIIISLVFKTFIVWGDYIFSSQINISAGK